MLRRLLFFLPDYLIAMIGFELRSYWGRLRSRPLVIPSDRPTIVNLGCGLHPTAGCINIDFFGTATAGYAADLRHPLRINDNTIDGIFSEHTLEHLGFADAQKLLAECYRILKPGGLLRIIVPDVELFVRNYCTGDQRWFDGWAKLMFSESTDPLRRRRTLSTPMEAISFITQEYGHLSAWDYPTLACYLDRAGFSDIVRAGFGQGQRREVVLDLDEADRRYVSLYVEAIK